MDNQSTSSAMTRIRSLVDEFSFVEVGALVQARSTDFNMADKKAPSDGVVTGYGTIDGNLVYVYAQDSAVLGGSMGEMHARKIANLYDMAMKMGAPVVELTDCSGLRLEEACDALYGFGRLYHKKAMASGVIPTITAVFGQAGGGMAVLAAMSDFTLMEEKNARLFVNAPDAVLGNKDDQIAQSASQAKNGVLDFSGSEEEIYDEIRRLISILPANNEDTDTYEECTDDLNRSVAGIEKLETAEAFRQISDNGIFVETKRGYSRDMVTGFIRLNGETVGVVGNKDQALTYAGAKKAAKLIRFCDAFEIPVLTLADAKLFENSRRDEKRVAKAAAELAYTYSESSVPMVTVVKTAFGTAGLTMGSKALGTDIVFALENASIGVMDAQKAAEIIYGEDAADLSAKTKEYNENQNSALAAARRGYVDDIIRAEEIRQRAIAAFEMLFTKSVFRPDKKHGTI